MSLRKVLNTDEDESLSFFRSIKWLVYSKHHTKFPTKNEMKNTPKSVLRSQTYLRLLADNTRED